MPCLQDVQKNKRLMQKKNCLPIIFYRDTFLWYLTIKSVFDEVRLFHFRYDTERMNIQMSNGRLHMQIELSFSPKLCSNQWVLNQFVEVKVQPLYKLAIYGQDMVNDCQLFYFASLFPTQDQSEKAKCVPQSNHTRPHF